MARDRRRPLTSPGLTVRDPTNMKRLPITAIAAVCLLADSVVCPAQNVLPSSAPSLANAATAKPWTNSLGMRFVPVPGTKLLFSIWETRVKDYAVYAAARSSVDESWRHPGFTQQETHPVVSVTWDEAREFCRWLTQKERAAGWLATNQTYRLPTDAEWSWAVGIGGQEPDGSSKDKDERVQAVYPWGTQAQPPKGAGNYDPSLDVDSYDYTAPVGSFAANLCGLYDLGGNVWEWCEDTYSSKNPSRVLRGASWKIEVYGALKSSRRGIAVPSYRFYTIGFRVVLGTESSSR